MYLFFNDPATTEIYTLSLHDALPIFAAGVTVDARALERRLAAAVPASRPTGASLTLAAHPESRSEEHTSELQSQSNLVCRLLLEKKKYNYFLTRNRC